MLAVNSAKRLPQLSDAPTLVEAGVPGYKYDSWFGVMAPAATPMAILTKVSQDIAKALQLPDVHDKLIAQGAVPQASTPAELQKLIDTDRARYGRIIREKGLKAE